MGFFFSQLADRSAADWLPPDSLLFKRSPSSPSLPGAANVGSTHLFRLTRKAISGWSPEGRFARQSAEWADAILFFQAGATPFRRPST